MVKKKEAEATPEAASSNGGAGGAWREVLIIAGTPVRAPLAKGDVMEGVYLSHVRRQSKFGPVNLHVMLTPNGLQGLWGSHALDEGLSRCKAGVQTRIEGRGIMELDSGKTMRLVRIHQRGLPDPEAPIIDRQQQADEVYRALGLADREIDIDPETGEVLAAPPVFAPEPA